MQQIFGLDPVKISVFDRSVMSSPLSAFIVFSAGQRLVKQKFYVQDLVLNFDMTHNQTKSNFPNLPNPLNLLEQPMLEKENF